MRPPILPMLACCLLSGCASGPTPTPALPAGLPPALVVPPPPDLLQPPRPLPPPASGRMRDLEINHLQVAQAWHDLAQRLCRLQAWVLHPAPAPEACRPWLIP